MGLFGEEWTGDNLNSNRNDFQKGGKGWFTKKKIGGK